MLVAREIGGLCERDERDDRVVSEVGDAVAHGDRVGGTRQSMDVAMKDEHHDGTALSVEPPRHTTAVLEHEGWRGVADVRSTVVHRQAV
ncbi:MAG: hypothetical protein DHS20C19_07840 [Acidimicrobiales bacterium]|nr:MAG: hypothetical protein DHS20C19_07840 [Acidimicrobiales bacterium]